MKMTTLIRLVLGMIFTFSTIYTVHLEAAPSKPSLITSTADLNKVDKAGTTLVDYAIYFAYIMGAVAAAIGLAISAPIIGKSREGLAAIKGGCTIVIVAGVFHVLLGIFGNLF